MITPMQMYWLLKLDDIRAFCAFCVGFAILAIIISLAAYNDDETERVRKNTTVGFALGLFGLGLFGGALTFLPSTKQMATIYVVPAIANNEKIQQIGGKTLDISNQLLDLTKEYLESKAKDK